MATNRQVVKTYDIEPVWQNMAPYYARAIGHSYGKAQRARSYEGAKEAEAKYEEVVSTLKPFFTAYGEMRDYIKGEDNGFIESVEKARKEHAQRHTTEEE